MSEINYYTIKRSTLGPQQPLYGTDRIVFMGTRLEMQSTIDHDAKLEMQAAL